VRRTALSLLAAAGVLLGAFAGTVPAASASVEVMVVGRSGVLKDGREVATRSRRVKVGRRRCAVGSRTPLAALAATGLRLTVTDSGACGRSARDAGGLFVAAIAGERNRGDDGWFYKVDRRAGTTGAGAPEGPFGTGRGVRDGQRITWFYCRTDPDGDCQRTLEVRPAARAVTAGGTLVVTVRGYDNDGRGVPAGGASVALGGATATAGPDGVATLTAPLGPGGPRSLTATADGMIDAFPTDVTVR